jgi:hypothetical protein
VPQGAQPSLISRPPCVIKESKRRTNFRKGIGGLLADRNKSINGHHPYAAPTIGLCAGAEVSQRRSARRSTWPASMPSPRSSTAATYLQALLSDPHERSCELALWRLTTDKIAAPTSAAATVASCYHEIRPRRATMSTAPTSGMTSSSNTRNSEKFSMLRATNCAQTISSGKSSSHSPG